MNQISITWNFITALKQIFDSGQFAPDSQITNLLSFVSQQYQINFSLNQKYITFLSADISLEWSSSYCAKCQVALHMLVFAIKTQIRLLYTNSGIVDLRHEIRVFKGIKQVYWIWIWY